MGSNFGAVQGAGVVHFGGQAATITSWIDSVIVATIPSASVSANMFVTADDGLSSTPKFFVVNSGGPLLQFSSADTPLEVNLTSPQNLDWVYWGRISASQPDRKAGLNPLISDYTTIAQSQPSQNSSNIAFSWSDGDRSPLVSEATADLEIFAPGGGFQILARKSMTLIPD